MGGEGKVFGFTDTSNGQLLPSEVRQVGKGDGGRPDLAPQAATRDHAVMADNPAHADHSTYQQIHAWVTGTGNWNEEQSRNVAAALYKQQVEDPVVKRVDRVTGALGKDGAENVFAVYAPFGDKGPFFHAHVDGRQAAQEPAQQSLQQAEVLQQTQARQPSMEQTNPLTPQQGPPMTMDGP